MIEVEALDQSNWRVVYIEQQKRLEIHKLQQGP
jgi:hypothetical protein